MDNIVIKVENLSKKYTIGSGKSGSLRETLSGVWHNAFGRKSTAEDFWALKDINFKVKQGEALGIIGRNGAGKSTLLKLLSKITYPTTGKITMNGRVSSLLEVGTGFHPELTGRENIYLNGTILGMSRKEVRAKFDEIVDFSGVEKFLDTPVKRYSSGMYVRLAFAVAAHLEPEILIIDEVLSVGDAEFQKKCLGKMDEVAKGGRTVIFVSHNMGAIRNLCRRCIFLSNGEIKNMGTTNDIINSYLNFNLFDNDIKIKDRIVQNRLMGLTMEVQLDNIFFNKSKNTFATDENIEIIYNIKGNRNVNKIRINATIFNEEDYPVGSFSCPDTFSMKKGEIKKISLKIINHNLALGNYSISTSIGIGDFVDGMVDFDIIRNILNFSIFKYSNIKNVGFNNWERSWGNFVFKTEAVEIK